MNERVLGKVVLKSGQTLSDLVFDANDSFVNDDLKGETLHQFETARGGRRLYFVQGDNIAYIELDFAKKV